MKGCCLNSTTDAGRASTTVHPPLVACTCILSAASDSCFLKSGGDGAAAAAWLPRSSSATGAASPLPLAAAAGTAAKPAWRVETASRMRSLLASDISKCLRRPPNTEMICVVQIQYGI